MSNITIRMRDGSTREFKHAGRPGGSYTKRLRYEPGFVVVTDEYYHETAIPTDLVDSVEESPTRW
jgi:hypothetical protein